MHFFWLFPFSFFVGILGTVIGVGGGFILIPVLLFIYPHENREVLAAMCLMVVFFNAFSGTIAYARMKRINYRAGVIFALAASPGAVLGALTTSLIPKQAFDISLGIVLALSGGYLLFKANKKQNEDVENLQSKRSVNNLYLGAFLSMLVGFLSSLLGLGGGIIHVPLLIFLLGFPVHIATATSHFVLAFVAGVGSLVHVFSGTLAGHWHETVIMVLGVMGGAQIGAFFSKKVQSRWIIISLALALIAVGVRLVWGSI